MSNDPEERAVYDMRAKILKDKISELNAAEEKGREEGREEGDINRAKIAIRNMLSKKMDAELISELLEVSIELVREVQSE